MKLNERIKRARVQAGLTQPEMAAACGVSRILVSYWENGSRSPSRETLMRISEATMVPVGAFLDPDPASDDPALIRATPSEIDMLRFFRRLSGRQQKNLLELLAIGADVRRQLAHEHDPAHGLKAPA